MSASESISFRLSPQFAEQLQAESVQRGMSKGELARQLVVERLLSRGPTDVAPEIAELPSLVRSVVKHLSNMEEQICSNHTDVKRWLTQILRTEPQELTQAVATANAQVVKFREDFATGLVVLLTQAAGWKVEDAAKWVQTTLLDHK